MPIPNVTRALLRHRDYQTVYAIEVDFEGTILGALDVTTEVERGGLCGHLLETLPLAGSIDTVELLTRHRDDFEPFTVSCGNVHHLFNDLLRCEKDHRAALAAFATADARAKGLKKEADARGAKVHELLGKLADAPPLPLFDGLGAVHDRGAR